MKVLLVDDSVIIRKALTEFLSRYEVDVIGEAGDGVRALEIFKSEKPDLVTLDITMPEMDGLSCLREILAINSEALVLIVTALKDKETALKAIDMGAVGYIQKPFNKETLEKGFSKVLNSK